MNAKRRVLVASDHAGLALKGELQARLPEYAWEDLGPRDATSVDYPDYAAKLADGLGADFGVLVCGSGIGMSIAANKRPGVRAAVVENPVAARLAREHNDANVLCLGARFTAPEYAAEIAKVFLETPFSGGARHAERVRKIREMEGR